MAIAPMQDPRNPDVSPGFVHAALARMADSLTDRGRILSRSDLERTLVEVEDISRVVDYLQVFAAGMAEERDLASGDRPRGVDCLQARAEESLGCQGAVGVVEVTASGERSSDDASGTRFRTCADYLRAVLGISRAEAKRRLDLAHTVLPGVAPSGALVEPQSAIVSAAFASGTLSGRAATVICSSVQRVRCLADPDQLASMEHHLTRQALESDEDVLRVLARRWETLLDQDGQEPTEKVLRSRQGVFFRGRRNGLRILEIGATDEQFEHLVTVMTTATNPRTPDTNPGTPDTDRTDRTDPADRTDRTDRTDDDPQSVGGVEAMADDVRGGALPADRPEAPTRAQMLLDGLVGACRIALSTSQLPATGGHRPQVMVTIDYRDLLGNLRDTRSRYTRSRDTGGSETGRSETGSLETRSPDASGRDIRSPNAGNRDTSGGACTASPQVGSGTGRAVFTEYLTARTIRRIACDAELIPLVLGGEGQILDIGRAGRLFPPHLRRALVARDRGCAFPDCTIPAPWCEAHHLTPWAQGGATSIDNGVLLCAHHHHVIHDGGWTVASHSGIPWFTAPPHLHRHGITARRNRYWHAHPALPAGTERTVPKKESGEQREK